MMHMLKLTDYSTGAPVWINAGHVVAVTSGELSGNALLAMTLGAEIRVREKPERVVAALDSGADAIAENGDLVFDDGDEAEPPSPAATASQGRGRA